MHEIKMELNDKGSESYKKDIVYVPLTPFQINILIGLLSKSSDKQSGCKSCHGIAEKFHNEIEYLKHILMQWREKKDF